MTAVRFAECGLVAAFAVPLAFAFARAVYAGWRGRG